ncbi:MAG: 2Fe-2S iron-sulfur cluster binding domain-containing protein, partial [Myxococcales bacterium]|nr:2Fe-2S iron-sulfur cluster binding domain-containing protein [Myxococcales bacterium]
MDVKLKIWRQKGPEQSGFFEDHKVTANPHMSFLEMLDVLNEQLLAKGQEPVAFDHDCREGICGACSMVIDGKPHGPRKATTTCQLHMREYQDGAEIVIEPWRAKGFPIIKDLVVDRRAFDRIQQAGGYVSVGT